MNNINNKISEVRRKEGESFAFFRKCYFSHYNNLKEADFHKEISGLLQEKSDKRQAKVAIAAPRGSAKSTIVTIQYALYSICYTKEDFIIIISNTSSQAEGAITDIKHELETNEKLIEDFPDICEIGQKPGPDRWRNSEIITRNKVRVMALGSGQQIRGIRNKEHRPSLIILDDVEAGEGSPTLEGYKKIHRWFTRSVIRSGDQNTNIFVVGTIHHYNSLLSKLIDPKTGIGWEGKKYQSVISWASRRDMWQEWTNIFCKERLYDNETGEVSALRYFEGHKEDMLKDTKVLWQEQHSYYELMRMRETEGYASFDSEMQNEPVNPDDCVFNPNEIRYWDDEYKTEEELLRARGDRLEYYGACDPSIGKSETSGDYTAIITAAIDLDTRRVYILDVDLGRKKPDQIITDIIAHHYRRNYEALACESNQFQDFLADEIINRSAANSLPVPIEKVNNTSSKQGRIRSLQPFIKNGMILFSRKHQALLEQLRYYPKAQHDDGPDALEMAFSICQSPPLYEFEYIEYGDLPREDIHIDFDDIIDGHGSDQ